MHKITIRMKSKIQVIGFQNLELQDKQLLKQTVKENQEHKVKNKTIIKSSNQWKSKKILNIKLI